MKRTEIKTGERYALDPHNPFRKFPVRIEEVKVGGDNKLYIKYRYVYDNDKYTDTFNTLVAEEFLRKYTKMEVENV